MGFVNMRKNNDALRNVEKIFQKFVDARACVRFQIHTQGEYYQLITQSIKNFRNKKATPEDVENLEDFYLRIDLTSRALSIKDEKGFFPANYFVFMPIPLYLIKMTLRNFSNCGFLKDKDMKAFNMLREKIRSQSGIFCESFLTIAETTMNTRTLLESKFKFKSTRRDGTIVFDYSSDEKFEEFVEKVYATIEEYNLPNSEVCCTIVGNEIAHGRNPINLKEMAFKVEKDKEK